MEKPIKFIRIPLVFTGFDIFNESDRFQNKILHFISYTLLILMQVCFFSSVSFEKRLDLSDKIYIYTGIQAYFFVKIQLVLFWYHRKSIVKIFNDIKNLHGNREETYVEDLSCPIFEKCSAFLIKFCK